MGERLDAVWEAAMNEPKNFYEGLLERYELKKLCQALTLHDWVSEEDIARILSSFRARDVDELHGHQRYKFIRTLLVAARQGDDGRTDGRLRTLRAGMRGALTILESQLRLYEAARRADQARTRNITEDK
jgi:hypothetical protein